MTTTEDAERLEWLGGRTMRLISAAMDRDSDTVSELLGEVGERYGHDGVYAVCCALSEAVRTWAFPTIQRGDGSLTGDMLAIEKLPGAKDDRATEWACRFVVAYVNGDADNSTALFFGQLGDEDLILGGVAALVGMVGDLGRAKEAEAVA